MSSKIFRPEYYFRQPNFSFNYPQGPPTGGISPGVDSEIFNEGGITGPIVYHLGTEAGNILIDEP
jgi:hypothetical protein